MPPLVLVPGLMCDAGLFSGVMPALSRQRAVFVADIGQDDSMATLAERLLAQVVGPFDLLGFSMGGFVALEVLKKAPERVRRLALLDTNARADTPDVAAWREGCIARAKGGGLMDIMRDVLVPRYFDPDRPAPALARSCLETAEAIGADVFCRQFRAIADRADRHDTLRGFQGPALVLRGSLDTLCDRDAHLQMAEALADRRYVEIDGAAHLSILERPEAVARELRSFLKGG